MYSTILTISLHHCVLARYRLVDLALTILTLCSCPPHITGASIRSCAGPSIFTRADTDSCIQVEEYIIKQTLVSIEITLFNPTDKLTITLWHDPTPLSIRLAGSTVWPLQCVAYITGVGHYRVVGCTGETALAICGSTRITTVDGCMQRVTHANVKKPLINWHYI